jgi:hypothetical protein
MNTLMAHLTVASLLAVHHLDKAQPSAAGAPATQSVGSVGLALLLLVIIFLAIMAKAARGMADLIAGFLRVAASMTWGVVLLVVILIAIAVLVFH